jgi:alkylhydroperoxidase family enzyme
VGRARRVLGSAAGLGEVELAATVFAGPDAPCWNEEEALLVRLADELHEDARPSDGTWTALRARFAEDQLIELLVLAGLYRAISYAVNGTGIELEPGALRFPTRLG